MTMSGNHLQILEMVGKSPRWLAIIHDEALHGLFNQIALKDNCPLACVQKGDLMFLHSLLSEGIEPQVIIIDLSISDSLMEDVKKALSFCPSNTHLIVIGKEDHISIFRDLKHLGVTDYLILPVVEEDIHHALKEASLALRVTSEDTAKNARPFTGIIGVRGGVGASTIAVNATWMTFNEYKKKVCLVDLDLYNNTICVLLDLIPNVGLNDAVNEISRVDEVFFKRVLLQKEEGFSILTGQIGLEQEINFPAEAISRLTDVMRDSFEYVYIDIPFSILHMPFTQTILSVLDNIVVVTDLSLVSVQALLRLKSFFGTYFPYVENKIIVNNIFPGGGTVSKEMFEKSTNLTIQTIFPYCQSRMLEGVNAGEPFVKTYPKHAYSKQLRTFITSLYPQLKPAEGMKPSLFKKWLGLDQ
ncbi:MAG: hypothetical protein A3F42_02300 [Gammaproteobacteria bacterium RIFCSPHIGHO2_12_FULL_37_34]|nr:MAG: hypothetical protein A3F42_02300 [Gammaproteobacteria bacterium RIFCSPHIGHO2_12_FULL_37_34]